MVQVWTFERIVYSDFSLIIFTLRCRTFEEIHTHSQLNWEPKTQQVDHFHGSLLNLAAQIRANHQTIISY